MRRSVWNNFHELKGRTCAIATMHGKETIIGPLIEKHWGVNWIVPFKMNTDIYGTFDGLVKRKVSPIEAARAKCEKAIEMTGCDLAISNEGSFGSHPYIPFTCADVEIIMMVDKKRHLELTELEISTKTNFNYLDVSNWNELEKFAIKTGFPSHKIILRDKEGSFKCISKDIATFKELYFNFLKIKREFNSVFAETDMRAMNNPMRKYVIKRACRKLIKTVARKCPQCGTGGFKNDRFLDGLMCRICNNPTSQIAYRIFKCPTCQFEQKYPFKYGIQWADPMYCDYCNP